MTEVIKFSLPQTLPLLNSTNGDQYRQAWDLDAIDRRLHDGEDVRVEIEVEKGVQAVPAFMVGLFNPGVDYNGAAKVLGSYRFVSGDRSYADRMQGLFVQEVAGMEMMRRRGIEAQGGTDPNAGPTFS
ncbi:MAG: hypothetical protein KDI90_10780 [Alphaproteobacteria bacterium]|nr:hypothetical protein [Alphaproteobacteria bacterium]MCB9975520.1 hypothetical protein [Rhodospirillales bacterium]